MLGKSSVRPFLGVAQHRVLIAQEALLAVLAVRPVVRREAMQVATAMHLCTDLIVAGDPSSVGNAFQIARDWGMAHRIYRPLAGDRLMRLAAHRDMHAAMRPRWSDAAVQQALELADRQLADHEAFMAKLAQGV